MSNDDILCAWSDLPSETCHHCDPAPRTAPARTDDDVTAERIAATIARYIQEDSERLVYPTPHVPNDTHSKTGKTGTRRWNPGNLAAQIGGDLTLIRDMFGALRDEAETRSNDNEFPGGDATVMLGPGADVEAFGYVQISAALGRINPKDVVIPDKRDLQPPLAFLASWTDIIRAERNQPTYLAATVDRELDYIRGSIDWMFSLDDDGQHHFLQVDDLADQLSAHRRRLEDILKDGARAEFTRVRCIAPACDDKPRLMKIYAAQTRWDRYRCWSCKTEYTGEQYNLAKSQAMHDASADRFISQVEAAEAAEVPIVTVSSWAARGNVKTERNDKTGALLVWWPDVRERATTRRERLERQAVHRAKRKAEAEAKAAAEEHAERDRKHADEQSRVS